MVIKAGEISELVELLEKYKIESTGLGLLVVVFYLFIKNGMLSKFFNSIFEKLLDYAIKKKNKNNVTEITISEIENHDLFSYIDFWRYSKVPTLKFSSEFRTIAFRKYLSIYLKSHKDKIQSYVNSKTYVNMSDSELWKSLLNLLNSIVFSYESELAAAGVPKVIVEKMKVKNNDFISLTIDLIENVCTSQFYKSENNLLKIYSVLNILLSILESTVHNSETVCNSINGELSGLKINEGGKDYQEP